MITEFYVDMLDATGTRVGDGPLTNLLQLNDRRSLDMIGACEFSLPATDERRQYLTAGSQFDIYDRVDGYLGRFYYASQGLSVSAQGEQRLNVRCHDQLVELTRQSVHFRRVYSNQPVENVVANLVAEVAGWTSTVDAGIGNTSVMYEGESILRALDVLRDRWNQHFRLGAVGELQFGAFGTDLGLVLTNLAGQVQFDIERNKNIAILDRLQLVEEADEVFNKLIPLGAGQGVAQLTIETATLGAYTVTTGVNADGSNYYYIEDAGSVAAYGRRERVLTLPQIRPITNSDANIRNAANALKLSAEAYIARHLIPRVTYELNVRALRRTISVGDLVRLQYRGVVDGYAYIDTNALFYVMDVQRQRDAQGNRSAQLQIATIAERRTQDTDIMLDVINDLRALKINIPITLTKDRVGPYIKRMNPTNTAEFTVFIGDEVTFLNYAKVRFRTSPLKSSVTTVSTVGSTVATTTVKNHDHNVSSSGSHGHPLTINVSGAHDTHTITIGNATGNTGAASGSTSGEGTDHTHDISVVDNSGMTGAGLYIQSSDAQVWWGSVLTPPNITTLGENEVAESRHTHDISHVHSLNSHSHSASAIGGDHTHSAATADSTTHDHNIVSSGAHDHDVDIASHNHSITYGIFSDTNYPQIISLAINGVDRTVALGGTWAPANASVEVEVDITTYLVNAVGGLRQNHRITFSCAAGIGEIECDVNTLESIQAIAVS